MEEKHLKLKEIMNTFVDELSEVLTLDLLKGLAECALDFDTFHMISVSKNVRDIKQIGRGFLDDEFIHIMQLQLVDGSSVDIAIFHDSFRNYSFLKENEINVDTVECLNVLQSLVKDKRFVTNLQISAPSCMEFDYKEFIPTQLMINAIEAGGYGEVHYGCIDEVSEDVIERIP